MTSLIKLAAAAWLVAAGAAMIADAAAPAPAPAGNAARGAQTYAASCGSCHSLSTNRVGPSHRGVYGRKAGTAPGYAYSPALRKSRAIWNAQTLDRFLQNPQKFIPGTRMGFRLADPVRRADVIAYLRQQRGALRK